VTHRSHRIIAALLVFGTGWVAGTSAQPARRYLVPRTTTNTEEPPFSAGVLVGNTLYLSGTLGVDANNKAPDSPEAEALAALNTLRQQLAAENMTMDDLVWVQVFCSDVAHYETFNKVYRTFFKKELPARTFVGTGRLLYDARFEVQGIAVRR
jgi:enamine deaminase RidA (YjgF/YER057c/UK114 family)